MPNLSQEGARSGNWARAQHATHSLFTRIDNCRSSDALITLFDAKQALQQLKEPHELRNGSGLSLGHVVVQSNNYRLLESFVLSGCWTDIRRLAVPVGHQYAGLTAKQLAEELGYLVIRDNILECDAWEASLTPVMSAARTGSLTDVEVEGLSNDSCVAEVDKMGHNVFFWALTGECMPAVDYLLDTSSLTNVKSGANVLHMAKYASPEVVDRLFAKEKVSDLVNKRDYYTERHQLVAVYEGIETAIMGEDTRSWKIIKTDRNRSLRRMIQANEYPSRVSVLANGKSHVIDTDGRHLLDLRNSSNPKMLDRTPLHHAVDAGNLYLAESLLRHDARVDRRSGDAFGMTALHEAAMTGDAKMVKLLLDCGADPRCTDSTNSTPLAIAEDNHNDHIRRLLTAHL